MDVNGTHYRQFDDARALAGAGVGVRWSSRGRGACLEPDQELRLPPRDRDGALDALAASRPVVLDPFGTLGRFGEGDTRILHGPADAPEVVRDGDLVPLAPAAGTFEDMHLGGTGRLALLWTSTEGVTGVVVFDLARRWKSDVVLRFQAERVLVDRKDRVWAAGGGTLARCEGEPLPQPYLPRGDRFEPLVIDRDPPRVVMTTSEAVAFEGRVLALAEDGERVFALVDRAAEGQHVLARPLDADRDLPWTTYPLPPDPFPYATDLAVLDRDRVALLVALPGRDDDEKRRDVPVIDLSGEPEDATPQGRVVRERHPLVSVGAPRFVRALDRRVRYLDADSVPCRLVPLPLPRHVVSGVLELGERGQAVVDSGLVSCTWHRLYLEARIPDGCSVSVDVRVAETREELLEDDDADIPNEDRWESQPPLTRSAYRDERPRSLGLPPRALGDPELYEVLLQRATGNVRRMRGRYARFRLRLRGDGRHTPLVRAVRVYFPRFSYQEAYLPPLFRQQAEPDPREARANGAEFRERWFAGFEGILTPLEGRIAAADRLLDPWVCPSEALPWLASFTGLEVDAGWPVDRRRRAVAEAGRLQRLRGTLAGVRLALDIACDGAVARGQVVVVENHRLRRTMATVLGIDMDDDENPLSLGSMVSGNSIVGDSLILSEETARTFLALFDPALATAPEAEAVRAFFDEYGHRVTVLVHGTAIDRETQVRRTLENEMPAHVMWDVFTTDHPFVLGLAPLLQVDTWLERRPRARRVTLDDTWLTREGVLVNAPALSPRMAAARGAHRTEPE